LCCKWFVAAQQQSVVAAGKWLLLEGSCNCWLAQEALPSGSSNSLSGAVDLQVTDGVRELIKAVGVQTMT
jgi:hypothetical protein